MNNKKEALKIDLLNYKESMPLFTKIKDFSLI